MNKRGLKLVWEVLEKSEDSGNWWNLLGEFYSREEAKLIAAKSLRKTSIAKVFR